MNKVYRGYRYNQGRRNRAQLIPKVRNVILVTWEAGILES